MEIRFLGSRGSFHTIPFNSLVVWFVPVRVWFGFCFSFGVSFRSLVTCWVQIEELTYIKGGSLKCTTNSCRVRIYRGRSGRKKSRRPVLRLNRHTHPWKRHANKGGGDSHLSLSRSMTHPNAWMDGRSASRFGVLYATCDVI